MMREFVWGFIESIFWMCAVIGMITIMIWAATNTTNIFEFIQNYFN